MKTYVIAAWVKADKKERRPMVTGTYYQFEVHERDAEAAIAMVRKTYPTAQVRSCVEELPPSRASLRMRDHWLTVD